MEKNLIEAQLNQLETSGLVRVAQLHPELEYIFRHAMVQDAVYESLLRQDRKRLHRMVGETLERAYPERREELAAMLGGHFTLANETERALHYCLIAARSASSRYANSEAITHYRAALALALERGAADSLHELYLGLGKALRLQGRFNEAVDVYGEMLDTADASDNRSMLLDALIEQATVYATSTPLHDSELALRLCDDALTIAREQGNRNAESKTLWNMMLAHKFAGDARTGLPYGEQALQIARECDDRTQLAYILNDLGSHGYMDTSQFKRAEEALREAGTLWRELRNLNMLTDSLASLSIIQQLMGRYDDSLANAREAWRTAESIQNQWGMAHSLWMVGYIHMDQGRFDDAFAGMETGVKLSDQAGFTAGVLGIGSILAYSYALVGQTELALKTGNRGLELVRKYIPAWTHWMMACIALIHLEADDLEGAARAMEPLLDYDPRFDASRLAVGELWVALAQMRFGLLTGSPEKTIAMADHIYAGMRELGLVPFMPDILLMKGRALIQLNRDDEAHAALNEARQLAEAHGIRRTLWEALADLAILEARGGDNGVAAELQAQAAETLRYIEQRIKRPDFRATFLAQPHVRAVLEGG